MFSTISTNLPRLETLTFSYYSKLYEQDPELRRGYLFGKYLEVVAKGKTSDAIKKLVELAPATALLMVKDAGIITV